MDRGECLPPTESFESVKNVSRYNDDLEIFTVDESLPETARVVHLIESDEPLQHGAAVKSLQLLVAAEGVAALEAVLAPLSWALQSWEPETRASLAAVLPGIALNIPKEGVADLVLPLVLDHIRDIQDLEAEEAHAWLDAFNGTAPMLDPRILKIQLVEDVLAKANSSAELATRVWGCRLLGAVSRFLTAEEVESIFLEPALELCQDPNSHVRCAMCEALPAVIAALECVADRDRAVAELRELVRDEAAEVKRSALRSLPAVAHALPVPEAQRSVLPAVHDALHQTVLQPEVKPWVAAMLKQLLAQARELLCNDDLEAVLDSLRVLATSSDSATRLQCIAALPDAARTCGAVAYRTLLHDTFQRLAQDRTEEVRVEAAMQLHQLVVCLGPLACCLLHRPLLGLLDDEAQPVRAAALSQLHTSIPTMLHACDRPDARPRVDELLDHLDKRQDLSCGPWRMRLSILDCIAVLPLFTDPAALADRFMTRLLDCCTSGPAVLAQPAANAAVAIFRNLQQEAQRTAVLVTMMKELGKGQSCRQRLAFIQISVAMTRRFSTTFFKETLLPLCIALAQDPVAVVRQGLCPLMPSLKNSIWLPEDAESLERLNGAMSDLLTDSDRHVRDAANAVYEQFKTMPVRVQSGGCFLSMEGEVLSCAEDTCEDESKQREEADFTLCWDEIYAVTSQQAASKAPRPAPKPRPRRTASQREERAIEAARSGIPLAKGNSLSTGLRQTPSVAKVLGHRRNPAGFGSCPPALQASYATEKPAGSRFQVSRPLDHDVSELGSKTRAGRSRGGPAQAIAGRDKTAPRARPTGGQQADKVGKGGIPATSDIARTVRSPLTSSASRLLASLRSREAAARPRPQMTSERMKSGVKSLPAIAGQGVQRG